MWSVRVGNETVISRIKWAKIVCLQSWRKIIRMSPEARARYLWLAWPCWCRLSVSVPGYPAWCSPVLIWPKPRASTWLDRQTLRGLLFASHLVNTAPGPQFTSIWPMYTAGVRFFVTLFTKANLLLNKQVIYKRRTVRVPSQTSRREVFPLISH